MPRVDDGTSPKSAVSSGQIVRLSILQLASKVGGFVGTLAAAALLHQEQLGLLLAVVASVGVAESLGVLGLERTATSRGDEPDRRLVLQFALAGLPGSGIAVALCIGVLSSSITPVFVATLFATLATMPFRWLGIVRCYRTGKLERVVLADTVRTVGAYVPLFAMSHGFVSTIGCALLVRELLGLAVLRPRVRDALRSDVAAHPAVPWSLLAYIAVTVLNDRLWLPIVTIMLGPAEGAVLGVALSIYGIPTSLGTIVSRLRFADSARRRRSGESIDVQGSRELLRLLSLIAVVTGFGAGTLWSVLRLIGSHSVWVASLHLSLGLLFALSIQLPASLATEDLFATGAFRKALGARIIWLVATWCIGIAAIAAFGLVGFVLEEILVAPAYWIALHASDDWRPALRKSAITVGALVTTSAAIGLVLATFASVDALRAPALVVWATCAGVAGISAVRNALRVGYAVA